jgi:uncharacterized protein YqhQ
MAEEKIRLGGMALANGVLVHGPSAWGCAVRLPGGALVVDGARKRFRAAAIRSPLVRGPARLLEVVALLPEVRRRMPEARLPFESPRVLATMAGGAVAVRLLRDSDRLGAAAQELASALLALAPAALALRNQEVAGYHGAEHVSIGTYEHGEPRAKEHERCGSHLIGPMLATTALGNVLAARAPAALRTPARLAASVGAIAVSTELFGWMTRHPGHPLSRALARPGHELQARIATAEPSPEQLEVAEAALRACLELEDGHAAER